MIVHFCSRQIVLDLDETLICAYNSLALPGHIHAAAASGGVRWFSLLCNTLEQVGRGRQGCPSDNSECAER